MTAEELAAEVRRITVELGDLLYDDMDPEGIDQFAAALLPHVGRLVSRAVAAERAACAKIVLAGGDGVDRLETAIRLGGNAAIAEAILARGKV